jgi:hypothetical protein
MEDRSWLTVNCAPSSDFFHLYSMSRTLNRRDLPPAQLEAISDMQIRHSHLLVRFFAFRRAEL